MSRSLSLRLAALPLAAAALASAPSPADAHPFGPPQTAEVTTAGDEVLVRWRFGADDDLSALAASLGVLPADRVLLDGVVLYTDGDDDLLAGDPSFAAYAETHLRAQRDGEPCEGATRPAEDLRDDGVVVALTCPAGDGPVTVAVDMLTDLHPAYRTLATGPGGQRAVYTAETPSHDWSLTTVTAADPGSSAASGAATSAALQLGGVLTGFAAAAGLGTVAWRRVSRRKVA
ncbi:hypothetical protein [Nocardioides flavescens]|uniref:LPXTG-motif cell wall anchor domain-containing protein n=1 Tax=Nocardioides flavescens TaxID=2691959 RepID=A0A6L7EVM8_9ACTN|nr:hypothetical protein [Nocardioides flavescens]MXG88255.1 hypothetical protein [Nocardioides flavescens]